jgi:curved DNA-binding protein CbpA
MEVNNFNDLEFNLYELLNLQINCTTEEIKKTFKRLIKKFHPDKITEIEEKLYYNITVANHILSNPHTRKLYDEWLLNSHKSHSSLKDNFKKDEKIIQTYFPQNKEEAAVEFSKKFDELGKRHGEYNIDNRSLQNIYKDKEKERKDVNVKKEDFSSMDEFNNKFNERKKNGIYCNKLVKRNMNIQPYTFKSNNFAELKDFENIYINDTQYKYAFELSNVDDKRINKVSIAQNMDEYNTQSKMLGNVNNNRFNNLDI